MKANVEKGKQGRAPRVMRVIGGAAAIGLLVAGAVPVGRLIIEARKSSKVAACGAMERVVERADRVALVTRRGVAESIRDHRWGEPSQREYLASATADLRQAALETQRRADALHVILDKLDCER